MALTSIESEFTHRLATLVEWAMAVELPPTIARRAALVLVDDLAAMIAARDEPELAALREGLLRHAGPAEAQVFDGRGTRADRYTAAVANAAAGDWCELDEGYRVTTCHAGLYTLPAVLAEGEAEGHMLGAMLRAVAVGYEVVTRFARGFPGTTDRLHPHGCFAPVGAAAACAALRGESAQVFTRALESASATCLPGPFDHAVAGALVRNVWPAISARSGMHAADWARIGIHALPVTPIRVFHQTFGGAVEPAAMTDGLGQRWAIQDNFQKLHACCQYAHATVEATLELRAQLGRAPNDHTIERVVVETHPHARQLDGDAPPTTLAARFSIPHAAAASALLGHAGAEAFSTAAIEDRGIAALRARVELAPFEPLPPPPDERPARVTWHLADGTRLSAECLSARGGPDRPFSVPEILAKIAGITTPVYAGFDALADELAADPGRFAETPWPALVARLTAA